LKQPARKMLTYIRARLGRRASFQALGPNEARILYDAAAGGAGAVVALVFSRLYLGRLDPRSTFAVLALPFLLLVFNTAYGVYSRLRRSSSRIKSLALLASAVSSIAVALAFGAAPAVAVLWLLLSYPAIALARLLLGLPYGSHRRLISVAVNHRGPVLVIGGAGYIGSHTVDLLLKSGRHVRVLDRLMYGREPLAAFADNKNLDVIDGDATDIAKLAEAMRGASGVVHLAGLVGDPACAVDPEFTRHSNVIATRMAKEVARSLGVHRFVFASSCSVYGVSDREVSESSELNPVSLYAQTKIDSEMELLSSVPDDFFVTVLRFSTVFGHSRRPRFDLVCNLFTAQAMTNGLITVIGPGQWRPFIHVRDLARAIVMVLDAPTVLVQSQIYNVGDRRLNMTILQLAEAVQRIAGRYREVQISVRDNPEDRRNYAVSFEKIRSHLNFQAETLMDAGIQEIVEEFLSGRCKDYRDPAYSNLAITRQALHDFHNPAEMVRLYAPLQNTLKQPTT